MESAKWLKEKVSDIMEAGGYEEAVPYLERLLKLSGEKPYDMYFAHFTLGEIHLGAGRLFRAQKHFQKAIAIGGEDPFVLLLLGQVYCAQGKHIKGRKTLDRAWSLKPGDVSIQISLGTCMCLQMEYEEAEEIFRRVIETDDPSHEACLGLAQSLMGQHRWDEAREVLEEAKERFPLVLTIRHALKDIDKVDELEEFYNWIAEDAFDEYTDFELPLEELPHKLARTAMAELQFPPEALEGAEKLWEDYIRIGHSLPRVPEVWAAGIVYTVAKLHNRSDISQAELARKFEVSAASVSRVFRTISNELKIKENDQRYRGNPRQI